MNTLVLVHRQQLLEQWVARLQAFLSIAPKDIGVVRGGKKKPTGVIDVAVMQSLARQGEVSDLVANYGHLVVDECHHLSAVGFEAVARAAKARYVLGLSATVTRKDGHHPIIFMQCGPIRHRVDARKQAANRPFTHHVIFRPTSFRAPSSLTGDRPTIQELYSLLAKDEDRNALIFDDIMAALEGGLGVRQRRATLQALESVGESEERVIVATGRYLGEGFDDAQLDTLFLTMPIAWRGTLAQYAGRLHRLHAAKKEVIVYDYVDSAEPTLARMAAKRDAGYRSLGYQAR